MTEQAVRFLARSWLHQVGGIRIEPPPLSDDALLALQNAYTATYACLLGGTGSALPPEMHVDQVETAHAILEHTDRYAVFLAILGRTFRLEGLSSHANVTFALNKALHALNVWVDVDLPRRFRLAHCVGTVIGRAVLGEELFVGHGCTIGSSTDEEYPRLGSGVSLRSGSAVLGRCMIGDNVVVSAGVTLINRSIPDNSLVLNEDGRIVVVESGYPRRFTTLVFGLPREA